MLLMKSLKDGNIWDYTHIIQYQVSLTKHTQLAPVKIHFFFFFDDLELPF